MESISPNSPTNPTRVPNFSDRIRDCIVSNLREEYPYMNIAAVHDAASASLALLQQRAHEQQSAIEASKQRSGFLSLSPELRNRIYETALRPENDGEGGVERSRAIFVGADDIEHEGAKIRAENRGYQITIWVDQPALTKLNRQVRSEALSVYYSNHFVLEIGSTMSDGRKIRRSLENARRKSTLSPYMVFPYRPIGAIPWLQRIGPYNVAKIKHLDVNLNQVIGVPRKRPRVGGFYYEEPPGIEDIKQYCVLRATPLPPTAQFLARYELHAVEAGSDIKMALRLWYTLQLSAGAETVEEVTKKLNPYGENMTLAYSATHRRDSCDLATLRAHLHRRLDEKFTWEGQDMPFERVMV